MICLLFGMLSAFIYSRLQSTEKCKVHSVKVINMWLSVIRFAECFVPARCLSDWNEQKDTPPHTHTHLLFRIVSASWVTSSQASFTFSMCVFSRRIYKLIRTYELKLLFVCSHCVA